MNKIKNKENIKNILLIGSIGIGNLLLFSPALKILRKEIPNANIIMIVLKKAFLPLFENDPNIDELVLLDSDSNLGISEKLSFLKNLRTKNIDLCITTFPANRREYNLLSYLSGAKIRIAHKYNSKYFKSLSFLQNYKVNVDNSLHDVDQNIGLLNVLGINSDPDPKELTLYIGESDKNNAEKYLKENKLTNQRLFGIHPGSSAERGMDKKRWSTNNFAKLTDWLSENHNYKVLIMGGPEEEELKNEILERSNSKPVLVKGINLMTTAAIIGKCDRFFSNDSGLMHIAVAAGVLTSAVFGPSDPGRTAPYGDKNLIISKDLDCRPCWSIRNVGVGEVKCVQKTNICLTELSFETVKDQLNNWFKDK